MHRNPLVYHAHNDVMDQVKRIGDIAKPNQHARRQFSQQIVIDRYRHQQQADYSAGISESVCDMGPVYNMPDNPEQNAS